MICLGRLEDAETLLRDSMKGFVRLKNWKGASIAARMLSRQQLLVGDVEAALQTGETAVEHADLSADSLMFIASRDMLADARHQAGASQIAMTLYKEAEAKQAAREPDSPRLYSVEGYRYCDLLLTLGKAELVRERATYALEISERMNWLLSIALDHLSLGRAGLALGELDNAQSRLDMAVDRLRAAGRILALLHGLGAIGVQKPAG